MPQHKAFVYKIGFLFNLKKGGHGARRTKNSEEKKMIFFQRSKFNKIFSGF